MNIINELKKIIPESSGSVLDYLAGKHAVDHRSLSNNHRVSVFDSKTFAVGYFRSAEDVGDGRLRVTLLRKQDEQLGSLYPGGEDIEFSEVFDGDVKFVMTESELRNVSNLVFNSTDGSISAPPDHISGEGDLIVFVNDCIVKVAPMSETTLDPYRNLLVDGKKPFHIRSVKTD